MASIFFTYEYSMVHICKCLYVEDPCRFLMISLKMTAISLFDGIWFFFLLLDSKKWVSFSRRFPIFSSPFRDIICMLPLKCRSFPFTHAYTITTTTTTTATTTTNVSYQSVRSWFFSFFPIFVMPVFRNIVQRSSFALFLLWWRRITFLIRCFFSLKFDLFSPCKTFCRLYVCRRFETA